MQSHFNKVARVKNEEFGLMQHCGDVLVEWGKYAF
jgi:hypothetical protein